MSPSQIKALHCLGMCHVVERFGISREVVRFCAGVLTRAISRELLVGMLRELIHKRAGC